MIFPDAQFHEPMHADESKKENYNLLQNPPISVTKGKLPEIRLKSSLEMNYKTKKVENTVNFHIPSQSGLKRIGGYSQSTTVILRK